MTAKPDKEASSFRLAPFEVRVISGQSAVRDALSQLLEALQPLQLDIEEAGTIEIVLAEVLNNILEHAYPPTEPEGPIHINCAHSKDGLLLHIKDSGSAMPEGKLPLGSLASLDVELDDMPEGGFGWFMIKSLAKDVSYRRVGAENHLNLRLAVGMSA
ncbi:MAG: ATP-binding protein [Pseudomonadota bacterium]